MRQHASFLSSFIILMSSIVNCLLLIVLITGKTIINYVQLEHMLKMSSLTSL